MKPGDLISGKYRVVRCSAPGDGLGLRFVTNDILAKPVALKVMSEALAQRPCRAWMLPAPAV